MGAAGRAKPSDKKSMRLAAAAAAAAAASIFRGSVHRREHSVFFLSYPPLELTNRNFVRCLSAQMGGRCPYLENITVLTRVTPPPSVAAPSRSSLMQSLQRFECAAFVSPAARERFLPQ